MQPDQATDKIIHMDDYRDVGPCVTINTGKAVHVYPVAYFEAWLHDKQVEDIPPDVLRAIVGDWLAMLQD